ncbi:acid phosphatase [Ophiocordyceps camponoti-floridani]|uniref:3-phytase n=1 Tax=Ophiocordyceps camponoti-floridani TaxID=2030778 RepID=A0A8H4Q9E0_9HYPO|nr:acid phosphatase [Ophiocordyceps camponoti-floridani]
MTSLEPRPPYSAAELATLYPPQLRLQLVQVLLRHGERTPVTARFANAGLPAFWPYCSVARQLRATVLLADDGNKTSSLSTLEWRRRLETFGRTDGSPVAAKGPHGEVDTMCDMGMLTDVGRLSTLRLGQRLRNLYVNQLGFLPASLDDDSLVYLRSTPVPRALESLQQAFVGLYPRVSRPPVIVTRVAADETLFPNDGNCRRLAALSRAFAERAAERWNGSREMAYLTKKLGRWMPEDSPKVAVDSRPRLSGIMDSINASRAHGPRTRLPAAFYDPEVKRIMEKIGVDEWYAGYKESREYRTLGIGSLVADVVTRMVDSAASASPLRLALSGCHDTTLAATLASLGAFDTEQWPPFTSSVAIELFRHADKPAPCPSSTSSSSSWLPSWLSARSDASLGRKPTPLLTDADRRKLDGYYVRIRYNDKPVTVPGCRAPGKHLEGDASFCTLEAFKAIVDNFTPRDWKQECRDVKADPFPQKPEPAGF